MSGYNFFDSVNIAVEVVHNGGYPDAELLEVFASSEPAVPGGVSTVEDLNQLQAIFATEISDPPAVAVNSLGSWNPWGEVRSIPAPVLDQVVIPWPPAPNVMLPDKAEGLMRQAGYNQNFVRMVFRWPLSPGVEETKYIFNMADGSSVTVGAISGEVESNSVTNARSTFLDNARPVNTKQVEQSVF